MKKLVKVLYSLLPFKRELFSFIKFFYLPPQSIYKHLHFKGIIKVKVDKLRSFKINHHGYVVENEIFWSGLENGWEKASIALWIKLCENADTVFDIGANTGIYALIAKAINSNAQVYCFEPIPKVCEYLKENIVLNNYDIHTSQVALSDHSGKAKIFLPQGNEFEYSVTVNKNNSSDSNAKEVEIEICDMASFISTNNILNIDLMKIDVETHEVEVLNGMGEYLKKFKPTMIIEILQDDIAEKLDTLLKPLGYLYFDIDDATGKIKKMGKLAKSSYYNYLVCSPEIALKLGL